MSRQNAGRALTARTRPAFDSENNVAGRRRLQLGCWGGWQSEPEHARVNTAGEEPGAGGPVRFIQQNVR